MKHVIPAALALSLAASGIAYAQTANTQAPNSPATSPATGTTGNAAHNSANTAGSTSGSTAHTPTTSSNAGPSSTIGSPNTADTNAGHGANALGTAPVGNPNVNTSIGNNQTGGNTQTGSARGTGADKSDASNNAVNTRPENNPGAPHPGANSFTEGQARSRIEDKGFSQVTDLKKDDKGVWRGHAMKDGKQTSVALDFQGNVVAQ